MVGVPVVAVACFRRRGALLPPAFSPLLLLALAFLMTASSAGVLAAFRFVLLFTAVLASLLSLSPTAAALALFPPPLLFLSLRSKETTRGGICNRAVSAQNYVGQSQQEQACLTAVAGRIGGRDTVARLTPTVGCCDVRKECARLSRRGQTLWKGNKVGKRCGKAFHPERKRAVCPVSLTMLFSGMGGAEVGGQNRLDPCTLPHKSG